jgi:acyl-coenzyme A thioesterase PaaI-like protein
MVSAAHVKAGIPVMTIDMHVMFLAAILVDVAAEGRVIRAGRSALFAEAELPRRR